VECDRNYIAMVRIDLTPTRKRCRRFFALCVRALFTKRSKQRSRNNPPHIREVKLVLSRSFPLLLWISAARICRVLTCAVSSSGAVYADEKFRPRARRGVAAAPPRSLSPCCASSAGRKFPQKTRRTAQQPADTLEMYC
jgi:hypothetical protein